jgi:hypothetical protein
MRIPSVPGAKREGQQRVDLTRSPSHTRTTASCAHSRRTERRTKDEIRPRGPGSRTCAPHRKRGPAGAGMRPAPVERPAKSGPGRAATRAFGRRRIFVGSVDAGNRQEWENEPVQAMVNRPPDSSRVWPAQIAPPAGESFYRHNKVDRLRPIIRAYFLALIDEDRLQRDLLPAWPVPCRRYPL